MNKYLLTPLYCEYEIKGNTFPYEDTAYETITMKVMAETEEGIFEIGTINMIRIPSHKNFKNVFNLLNQVYTGYDMAAAMESIDDDLRLVADEMKLAGDFAPVGFRQYLLNNDLYYLSLIQVKPEWRGHGAGSNIMKRLPQWLQRITHDAEPVIALLPVPVETDAEYGSMEWDQQVANLKHFYNKVGYRTVSENSQTLAYVPKI